MVGDGSPDATGSGDVHIRTFLIADVRGYTLFTQERGDEAAGKLAAKFARLAREGVEGRGGTLLELRGDEALCVFGSPRQAIRAAVELQERFVEETLTDPELPLTVGIGLDAGEAVAVEGGYRGGALNLAARLCGHARAGEILASREVAHLARRVEGVRYEDRGALSLKGMAEPVHVVGVRSEGVDTIERLTPYAPPARAPRRDRRRWVVPVGIALVLTIVAIAIPFLRTGGGPIDVASNSIARIDAEDGSLQLSSPLGQRPGASAIGFGSLWVTHPDAGVLARLDRDDGSVVDTIPVGTSPAGVTVGDDSVWVTNAADGTVSRVSPDINEATETIEVGTQPTGIAVGDGALWVANAIDAEVSRLDLRSGETREVPLAGRPSGVAFTSDGVWVTVDPAGVARVDPATLSVTGHGVGNGPTAVLAAFGSIWVANHLDGTVSRLDPATGRVQATIPVGDGPNALGAAAGSLWVANAFDDSITEIDPATNVAERALPVGAAAASLVADGEQLWLAVGSSVSEHRGGTLTVSEEGEAPSSLDPALAFTDSLEGQILSITNDGLLSFKKVGGAEGSTLVPDLASSLPQVSPDGLTYRFPLRQGIRYSTGEPVRPEDFRHGLERTFSFPDTSFLYTAIEGGHACVEDPSSCDLTESIVVDDEAVTFHLARPDPDLPFKLAAPPAFPVPASIPAEDQGLEPVPATGPYMIEGADPEGIRLVRNPAFEEWSAAAQPAGFVDVISFRFGEEPSSAFERVNASELDWMRSRPSPDDLHSFLTAHPDRVIAWPIPALYYVGFDARTAPFDDVLVRRALNYAIDRRHVAELGGPTSQRLTCQILPPNFQGYEPFCPYTIDPGAGGWSAPDLERARALIGEAGVVGDRVSVWVTDDEAFGTQVPAVETMRHVTEVLDEIGLRASLRIVRNVDAYFGSLFRPQPGRPTYRHAYMGGWLQTYPAAGGFIDVAFRCDFAGVAPLMCTDRLEQRIEQAQRLQGSDPAAANAAWIDIEHQLVEDAVVAPLWNPVSPSLVSDRVGNVQVHPQWGLLLSRLWVR